MSTLKPRPPRDPEHDRLNDAAADALQHWTDTTRAYDNGRATEEQITAARDAYNAAEAAYYARYNASGEPRTGGAK